MIPKTSDNKNLLIGIALALTTVIIWSGNYIVARSIAKQIPPVHLAFFRWGTATICLLPIAGKKCWNERHLLSQHKLYLLFTAIMGISLFNTFIYLAGHYTSAINLALIGTTSSPVFITFMAAIFLHEKIYFLRLTGMLVCVAGIIYLLSQGSFQKLATLHFGKGDVLILLSSFFFSIYSILVRKKPAAISPLSFLMLLFITGTIILIPFVWIESLHTPAVEWTNNMRFTILYLGIGNSVIGFLCWNLAISKMGAARTSLFANLMPLFSTIEAILILNEQFTAIHLVSGVLLLAGLIIANLPEKILKR
ncbi:MAG: DMT family transporter [Bacteroidota bacterium]|nr:DMT family transporter [Bacteroidota bacterium]